MKPRSIKMAFNSLAACWFVLWASAAFAEECYKLVHGNGNPVCRKFGQNLNRFCDRPPMHCELAIHPDFAKDFSFPKWEDIDPLANVELVAELVRSRASVAHDCTGECDAKWRELKWQEYRPKLLEGIQLGRIRFSRTSIDINHDGKKELVFRLMDIGCPPIGSDEPIYAFGGNPALMVLDESSGKFDRDFNRPLALGSYDVILHLGRASLIDLNRWDKKWELFESVSGPGVGRFHVLHRPVCEYQIIDYGRNK